jgi:putative oxidoreductase
MKETEMNNTRWIDGALLLSRIMLGVVFIFHGSQKLFAAFGGHGIEGFAGFLGQLGVPFPELSAGLAASAEFFGGILLISGVGVRLAVIPMIMTMLVASFTVHGGAFDMQKGGMEYPLTLAVMLTSLGLSGPGRYTLAAAWKKIFRTQVLETKGELS